MEEKKLIPKRRFKGFEGDWIKVNLGDMSKITMGQSPRSTSFTIDKNMYILVQGNADIKNYKIYPRVWTTEVTKIGKPGEIIFTVRAPVGEVAKTDFNVVLGRGVASISGNEFLFQFLLKKKYNRYWESLSTGSTFDSINSDNLFSLEIIKPNIKEQQKIGKFFRVLDERIANQERKIAKVKALKEAYLAEMFPQEGETVPKRRFKGFEGEWEKQLLGNITSIVMGHSPMSSSYTTDKSFPILVQGNADIKKNRIVPRVWTKTVTKMARKKDIIITVRAPVGEVAKTDYDVVLGRGVAGIGGSDYIFYYFYNLKREKYWERISTGSTFDSITSSQLIQLEILLPSLSEQQKIGAFFKNLDDQIEAEEAKLEKLKQMKEAYLEEMFV